MRGVALGALWLAACVGVGVALGRRLDARHAASWPLLGAESDGARNLLGDLRGQGL